MKAHPVPIHQPTKIQQLPASTHPKIPSINHQGNQPNTPSHTLRTPSAHPPSKQKKAPDLSGASALKPFG